VLTRQRAIPSVPGGAAEQPPKTVAWLHPFELLRTGYHVWLSTIGKEFIDRRETLAALDRGDLPEISPGPPGCLDDGLHLSQQDDAWIDFVADVGDSWNATYATAVLLATPELKVRGCPDPLPPAQVVVLGGDLVYPTPSRNGYRRKLRFPFGSAFPTPTRDPAPCLLAIPGNHDWYDGLTNFVREFCQGGFLGGWRLVQRRSYFAAKLTNGWWLWGIDIALDTRIDPPQQAYFLQILKTQFIEGDRIILCTAKPCWVDDPGYSPDAYRNLAYFVRDLVEQHGFSIPVILSGDLHHYCRYESKDGQRQLIVSGGGGAYLMGTHHLPRRVPGLRSTTAPASQPSEFFNASGFAYPSRSDSRRLALGALWLGARPANWPFCLFIGIACWLLAWPPRPNPVASEMSVVAVTTAVVIVSLCVTATIVGNRGPRALLIAWGIALAIAQISLALTLARLTAPGSSIARGVARLLGSYADLTPAVLAATLVILGGLAGATLVGLYLVVSDLVGWHRNSVFAAQSIVDYRCFLRMHIHRDGSLSIFPIGLRRVPRKWRARVGLDPGVDGSRPRYEPGDDVLAPHLIEGPIHIRFDKS
jgi:hypothetical protein